MISIMKNIKYYAVSVTILGLILLGMTMGRKITLAQSSRKPDVYGRVEEIKQVRHLELVTYYYESMVEVAQEEKADRSYLLLVIPAKVSCYLDLERTRFMVDDTLVRITLPTPELETPVLELDSARVINLNQRYVTASKHAYERVMRDVQRAMVVAKQDVLSRAEANGIREEAMRLGRGYFESFIGSLGYGVQFSVGPPSESFGGQSSPQSAVPASVKTSEGKRGDGINQVNMFHEDMMTHKSNDSIVMMPTEYVLEGMENLGKLYLNALSPPSQSYGGRSSKQ